MAPHRTPSLRATIGVSILCLFFFVLGACVLALGLGRSADARRIRNTWKSAEATILSRIEQKRSSFNSDKQQWVDVRWSEVQYEFEVDGKRHLGSWYDALHRNVFPEDVRVFQGQKLPCYYNPDDPSQVVLERTEPVLGHFYVFSTLFMAGSAVLATVLWAVRLRWLAVSD